MKVLVFTFSLVPLTFRMFFSATNTAEPIDARDPVYFRSTPLTGKT
jgi:hypothetical protein